MSELQRKTVRKKPLSEKAILRGTASEKPLSKKDASLRKRMFRRILRFLEKHPSPAYARLQIQILLLATAKGFDRKGTCILFSKDPLRDYAWFTKTCMETPADRKRLYRVSVRLGRLIRKITGFTDPEDCERLVFFLYRNIGITMTGKLPGEIRVSECYFSRVYAASQCSCISAMDMGIITGICGRGTLKFTERLTEGCKHCTAHFLLKQENRCHFYKQCVIE